jgi:hypothetical protein
MSSLIKSFVDDSGSGGDSRYFVLAGYSAAIEEWETFADAWQKQLDLQPSIEYFKMREAESLRDQFEGWSPEERNAKVESMAAVISKHDLWEASVAIPAQDYHDILEPFLPGTFSDPYLICFDCIIAAFAFRHRDSKIDFVFDNDQKNEREARRLYPQIARIIKIPGEIGKIDFEDDKEFVPLQAADLIAWQVRRSLCSSGEAMRPIIKKMHSDPLRWYHKVFHRSDMERMKSYMVDAMRMLSDGVFPQIDTSDMSITNPKFLLKP